MTSIQPELLVENPSERITFYKRRSAQRSFIAWAGATSWRRAARRRRHSALLIAADIRADEAPPPARPTRHHAHRTMHAQTCANSSDQSRALTLIESHSL